MLTSRGRHHEYVDGRRDQALDSEAQDGIGTGTIVGKTSVAEASRSYDLPPSEIENWVKDGRKGMGSALKANLQDVREQYECQLKELQEAYGEAMLAGSTSTTTGARTKR